MTRLESIELRKAVEKVLATDILTKTKFIIACQENIMAINTDLKDLMVAENELNVYVAECEATLKTLYVVVDGKYELIEGKKEEYDTIQNEYNEKINEMKEVINSGLKEETSAEILMMCIEDFPENLPADTNAILKYMLA